MNQIKRCTSILFAILALTATNSITNQAIAQSTDNPRLIISDPSQTRPVSLRIGGINVTGAENHNLGFIMSTANLQTGEMVTIPGE